MTDEEINSLLATQIMGWELLTIGYFGGEDETPRQRELVEWMVEVDIWQVGDYWIDVSTNFAIKTGEWMPATDIAQAWQVLEKFSHPRWSIRMFGTKGGWVCEIMWNTGVGSLYRAKEQTASKAISLCALKTLEKE